jgi:hypothetical protein
MTAAPARRSHSRRLVAGADAASASAPLAISFARHAEAAPLAISFARHAEAAPSLGAGGGGAS